MYFRIENGILKKIFAKDFNELTKNFDIDELNDYLNYYPSTVYDFENIKTIVIPSNVEIVEFSLDYNIGGYNNYEKNFINALIIPENVKKLEKNAFMYLVGIKTVVILNNNIEIEYNAFPEKYCGMPKIDYVFFKGTKEQYKKISDKIDTKFVIYDEDLDLSDFIKDDNESFESLDSFIQKKIEIAEFEFAKKQKILQIQKTSITTPLKYFLETNGFEVLIEEYSNIKKNPINENVNEDLIFDFIIKKDNINYLFEIDGKKCKNLSLALNDKTTNTIEEINTILLPFLSKEWHWMSENLDIKGDVIFFSGIEKINTSFTGTELKSVFFPKTISKICYCAFYKIENCVFNFEDADKKELIEFSKNKDNFSEEEIAISKANRHINNQYDDELEDDFIQNVFLKAAVESGS